jgi:hypothetical protein
MPGELSTDRLTFSSTVENLWITSGQGLAAGLRRLPKLRKSYFHWVETPKPAAMKPKPATMFQLPKLLIGRSPSVT